MVPGGIAIVAQKTASSSAHILQSHSTYNSLGEALSTKSLDIPSLNKERQPPNHHPIEGSS